MIVTFAVDISNESEVREAYLALESSFRKFGLLSDNTGSAKSLNVFPAEGVCYLCSVVDDDTHVKHETRLRQSVKRGLDSKYDVYTLLKGSYIKYDDRKSIPRKAAEVREEWKRNKWVATDGLVLRDIVIETKSKTCLGALIFGCNVSSQHVRFKQVSLDLNIPAQE